MKRFLIFVFGLTLLCAPAVGAAKTSSTDSALEKAKISFRAGQALFGASQFKKAAAKFMEAYGHKPMAAFLFNAAVCYEKTGEYALAKKYFVEYMAKAKDVKRLASIQARLRLLEKLIDYVKEAKAREVKAAKEKAEAERKRKEALAKGKKPPKVIILKPIPLKPRPKLPPIATKNIVSVQTEPPGADVFLDGRKTSEGVTPLQVEIPTGQHTITIKMKGFSPLKRQLKVHPNKMIELFMNLRKESKLAWIRVTANCPAADLYLDGKATGPIGKVPYNGYIPRGKHTLFVVGDGFKEKRLDITAEPGENNSFHVTLDKLPVAYLSIFGSRVRNAKVKLGRKVVCVAPCLKIRVPSGRHRLAVSKKGMKSVRKTIELDKGDHKNFSVELQKAPNRAGAITAYIIGLAAFGGGVYLGNMAREIKSDWDKKVETGVPVFSNDAKLKDGKIYSIGANVLFGVSALSLVIAVLRTFSESSPDSRIIQTVNMGTTSVSLTPFVAPGGSGVSVSVKY